MDWRRFRGLLRRRDIALHEEALAKGRAEMAGDIARSLDAEFEMYLAECEEADPSPPSPMRCRNCAWFIGDDIDRELAKGGRCYRQHGKEVEDLDHSWCDQWKSVLEWQKKGLSPVPLDKAFDRSAMVAGAKGPAKSADPTWKNATCFDCAKFVKDHGCQSGMQTPLDGSGTLCGEFEPSLAALCAAANRQTLARETAMAAGTPGTAETAGTGKQPPSKTCCKDCAKFVSEKWCYKGILTQSAGDGAPCADFVAKEEA